jgi:histidinol-phosphate aminotransferase
VKVSPEIANLVPYAPGKPIGETKREFGLASVVKLASNENALGPSPRALAAIQGALAELHRYPDPGCYELVQHLAQKHHLDPKWMVVGNGSNELIDLMIRVYCEPGDAILTSQAAFVAYKVCAQAARVQTYETPLRPDLGFDVAGLIADERRYRPKLIFLPNPNNPTGCYLNQREMQTLLQEWGGRDDLLVVIDEAYLEFVRAADYPQALSLLQQANNVVVIQTFSKVYGLAGLRLGVLYARPEVTDYLHRVRNPFNVNSLVQAAALAALHDAAYVRASQELVWHGLDYFYKELSALGLPYTPSQGNFVLFDTRRDAAVVYHELLKKGVVLRPLKPYGLPYHLRMSVGLAEENSLAIQALREVLAILPPTSR